MHTVLIAHRDVDFAEQLAGQLRAGGYHTIVSCPDARPPAGCICRLESVEADVMIYDPHMMADKADGRRHNLALDSALARPNVPLLLAWSPSTVPDVGTLRAIRAAGPRVHIAAQEPADLLRQIHDLLEEGLA